jgi:hypothetical protein
MSDLWDAELDPSAKKPSVKPKPGGWITKRRIAIAATIISLGIWGGVWSAQQLIPRWKACQAGADRHERFAQEDLADGEQRMAAIHFWRARQYRWAFLNPFVDPTVEMSVTGWGIEGCGRH